MKNLLFVKILTVLIVTTLVLSGMAMAADAAEVVFTATEKADDIIELDVTVKNAEFMVFHTALSYDVTVLTPVDGSGNVATEFTQFAEKGENASCFITAGAQFDAQNGYFGFAEFIMPGSTGDNINSKAEYVADDEGVSLYTFRFKRIAEGDCSFAVIDGKENDFPAAAKNKVYMANYETEDFSVDVSFLFEDKEPEKVTVVPEKEPASTEPEVEKEPEFTAADRKKDVICLQIGKALTISKGKKTMIDPDNSLVVPYITNDRTLVPIRFVAESLGAEVLWEEGWKYCIIKKGDKEIKLNFNSAEFEVNGEKITFDAPVELTQDRTMVPIRFVSEQLDCDVYWNDLNRAVVISPKDNPWKAEREAEITALNEMLISMSGLLP